MEINQTEQTQRNNQPKRRAMHLVSSTSYENNVVGLEDRETKIIDKLTLQRNSDRQIISISGMGGIGKTTLARKVYDHPYIKDYFHLRAWTTISKDYDIQESLVEILKSLGRTESRESLSEKREGELGVMLYRSLFGRRYLVILDDVWDVDAFDRLRSFFPASCGSGIIMTTRESTVASIGPNTIKMDLLDESTSWDLFCKNVFKEDNCPRELEDVGRNIAKNCRGLPLSIVVIGGHLAKSPRTSAYWQYTADNLSSIVNSEDDDHCLKILFLSYNHLPIHLKPCFLYMGIFPEDESIRVSQLIRLWVAEGFLKSIHGKSLEEAAEDYLNDLIGRNLILASEPTSIRGKVKYCKIHDRMRDLCLKEALKTNFLCIIRKQQPEIDKVSNNERRIVVHQSASKVIHYFYATSVLQSPAFHRIRTLILHGTLPSVVYKSLRALSSVGPGSLKIKRKNLVKIVHNLVNLRCLHFETSRSPNLFKIPRSIVFLWNLQSLSIVRCRHLKAPPEIWKMSQLRQIKIDWGLRLPDPPRESNDILKNLQSAKSIINFRFSDDLVKRVPNIKKLKVYYNNELEGECSLDNIARLEKLESFTCDPVRLGMILSNLTLPHSLMKLRICGLCWEDVTTKIGSLPLLEVLHLTCCVGPEWKLVEGQFVRLKYLKLYSCSDLECFTADIDHFPFLEKLTLTCLGRLKEICSDIGDISTLRLIQLDYCDDSAVACAKDIAEKQYDNGNEELLVEVDLDFGSSFSSEAESLSTSNFYVRCIF